MDGGLLSALLRRGMSRRAFLKFGVAMTGVLAMPAAYGPQITAALTAAPRIPLIWLRGQSCTGNSEAFMQAANPTVASLLLDTLSLEYDELLMTAAADNAGQSLAAIGSRYPDGYIVVIDGAIPVASDGVYCTVGGRTFRQIATELVAGAKGVIAVGSCAFDGGAPAAAGGVTGAVGAAQVVSSGNFVSLPGCPLNAENLAATLVHYLTFNEFPARDGRGRPLFAYGGLIHNQCERRAHYEYGEFVMSWGDEAAQKGWCLYKMGCKGPETFGNCPTIKYAEGASWAILAGHGCIGCTMPGFWNAMGGAYDRLPAPIAFVPNVTTDQIGLALVGAVGALTVVHGTASIARQKLRGRTREHAPAEVSEAAEVAEETAVTEATEIADGTEFIVVAEATEAAEATGVEVAAEAAVPEALDLELEAGPPPLEEPGGEAPEPPEPDVEAVTDQPDEEPQP